MRVYLCMDGSVTDTLLKGWRDFLISAAILWRKKEFRKFHIPPECVPSSNLFLDSGGFSFFYRRGEYPFSIQEYVELGQKVNPERIAVMDYPCEPEVKRIEGLKKNRERIERTVKNALVCMEHELNWVMVIQGYTVDEYMYCVDLIKEHGLLTKVMAVGSLCTRKSINSALSVLKPIKRELPSWVKLHAFGFDMRFLRSKWVMENIYSVDTSAWKFGRQRLVAQGNNRRYKRKVLGYMPKTNRDKLLNYEEYIKRLNEIMGKNDRKITEFFQKDSGQT